MHPISARTEDSRCGHRLAGTLPNVPPNLRLAVGGGGDKDVVVPDDGGVGDEDDDPVAVLVVALFVEEAADGNKADC